jgi:hypothetical protein
MHSDPAAAGRRALADRARRVSLIRRRIAATAVGAFALVWGLIAATGSMGAQTTSTASTTSTTSAPTGDATSATTQSDAQSLPPVTTGQS